MTDPWKDPVILDGKFIRLEPLSLMHVNDLSKAGKDKEIWTYMLYGEPMTLKGMTGWVRDILKRSESGNEKPFAVVLKRSGTAIGATRYLEMKPEHKNLEIGGTWYAKEYQRTVVNTECKYLLLTQAFEVMECIRVQMKTDLRNARSQRAIERLGAVKEGILRNHLITPEGYIRDSVYYSILDREWGDVKSHLETKLNTNGEPF